jgi:hypothetical protein
MTALTETKSSRGNVTALMVALLAACVAFQLNASMLSPALVTMGNELNTDQATIGLSQTWFFTAAALFSLFLPRLSDIVGRKKILVGMMLLMAVGSVIAAMAPDVTWLFVGRIIQGVSGPTVPLCLIMLRSAVTNPRKYGTLMGLITAVNGGVAGVDSFVGGYFAENFGFRSIFWLMVALALVATVLIAVLAGESKPAAGTTMDWLGVFFIVIAVGALLTALNEGAKLVGGFRRRHLDSRDRAHGDCRRRVLCLLDCGEARQAAHGGNRAPAPALHVGPAADHHAHHDRYLRSHQRHRPRLRPGGRSRLRRWPHRDVAHHPDPVCAAWLDCSAQSAAGLHRSWATPRCCASAWWAASWHWPSSRSSDSTTCP